MCIAHDGASGVNYLMMINKQRAKIFRTAGLGNAKK
jgi:hypothetical protein